MKLSIIVVTWNNEKFIEQALKSCININYSNYEIIVVHNASTDKTAEIIQQVTQGHESLFKIIENDSNLGLGEGRNIGIRHANGEYLLFLDGDDWYSENALECIFEILHKDSPDLVIFDFWRYHSNEHIEQNPQRHLLSDGWINNKEERAALLKNFGVAWNKLYKKSFIEKYNFKFPSIYYEDILWNIECIILAERIFVTQAKLIYYRQRHGSILRSTSMKHFDAIKQHNSIISFLESNKHLIESYGVPLRNYSRSQMFATIDIKGRVPAGTEGDFLKLAYKTLKKYDQILFANKTIPHSLMIKHRLREWVSSTGFYSIYCIGRFFLRLPKKLFPKNKRD